MRKLAVVLVVLALGLVPVVAVNAASIGGNPPAHWDCPNGLHVNLGGGPGFRREMRQAINWYNALRSDQARPGSTGRSAWPRIVSVSDAPWDGVVTNRGTCAIDFDEAFEGKSGNVATARLEWYPNTGHLLGCSIVVNGDYWGGGGFSDQYVVTHELLHCQALGHSSNPDSVMSTAYRCICLDDDDLNTMSRQLYPQYPESHGH